MSLALKVDVDAEAGRDWVDTITISRLDPFDGPGKTYRYQVRSEAHPGISVVVEHLFADGWMALAIAALDRLEPELAAAGHL